eukprot:1160371-Pelagomonas_calceolata.AAC.5
MSHSLGDTAEPCKRQQVTCMAGACIIVINGIAMSNRKVTCMAGACIIVTSCIAKSNYCKGHWHGWRVHYCDKWHRYEQLLQRSLAWLAPSISCRLQALLAHTNNQCTPSCRRGVTTVMGWREGDTCNEVTMNSFVTQLVLVVCFLLSRLYDAYTESGDPLPWTRKVSSSVNSKEQRG